MQRIEAWLLDCVVSLVLPRRTVGHGTLPRDGHAYVTLLTSENYLDGVLALEASLGRCGCVSPLWVVLGEQIGPACEKRLAEAGIPTCRMPPFHAPLDPELVALNESLGFSHWTQSYDRLAFFSMARWRKIVLIDSDMMVVRNTDGLFDTPHLSAVAAGRSYLGNENSVHLSGGLIVIEPWEGDADALAAVVPQLFAEAHARGERKPIGDQHVFNAYFDDWPRRPDLHLPEGYNVFLDHLDHYIRADALPRGAGRQAGPVHRPRRRRPQAVAVQHLPPAARVLLPSAQEQAPSGPLPVGHGALIRLARGGASSQGRG
jgi:hypothetical protein